MPKVINGDCLKEIPKLGNFDLAFADPPFNIGQDYKEYKDKKSEQEFLQIIDGSIGLCWEHCKGVLALHGPDSLVEHYLAAARKYSMPRVAWINWHYRFGQCSRSNWIDARCHCLIFGRKGHTWNPENVLVESDRASKYADSRVNETDRGGMRLPGTVWGVPSDGPYWGRVQGNSAERVPGRPNQLPEVYLQRLILAYTNQGDSVLDPFGGTGTTAVVAESLGRKATTIDIDSSACGAIKERLNKGTVRF